MGLDPDPECPKTYGSDGSGSRFVSATLVATQENLVNIFLIHPFQTVKIEQKFSAKTTKLILLDSLLQERPRTAKMREAPTGAGTPDKY
jgi:hypothetical protein